MMTSSGETAIIQNKMSVVLKAKNEGDIDGAICLAEKLYEEYHSCSPVCGLIATLYFDKYQYREAGHYFKIATQLAPHSETASLGLFHCLWEFGDTDDAFEEMKRFLKLSPSAEYEQILKEFVPTDEQ